MKWILLIILFTSSSNGGVNSIQVEYNNFEACTYARQEILKGHENFSSKYGWNKLSYPIEIFCTPKGE